MNIESGIECYHYDFRCGMPWNLMQKCLNDQQTVLPKKIGFTNYLSQDMLDHNITNISVRIQVVLIKTYNTNDGKHHKTDDVTFEIPVKARKNCPEKQFQLKYQKASEKLANDTTISPN